MTTNIRLRGLVLAAICASAACSSDGPTAPNEPSPETRWDIDVVVRYVKASGESACDGTDLLGAINPGEFQYRIVASHGSTTKSTQSTGYGQVTGESHALSTTEIHNFANQDWTFSNLDAGDAVKIEMWVTEWDGASEDDYMNHRSASLDVVPSSLLPTGGSRTDRALGVGTVNCGLTLYFDVNVRTRLVNVD